MRDWITLLLQYVINPTRRLTTNNRLIWTGGTSQCLASGPHISITLSRRCLSALTPRRTTAAAHPAPGVRPVLTKPTHGGAESEPWAGGRLAGVVMGGVERNARNVSELGASIYELGAPIYRHPKKISYSFGSSASEAARARFRGTVSGAGA
jgi:hypothetical protein